MFNVNCDSKGICNAKDLLKWLKSVMLNVNINEACLKYPTNNTVLWVMGSLSLVAMTILLVLGIVLGLKFGKKKTYFQF